MKGQGDSGWRPSSDSFYGLSPKQVADLPTEPKKLEQVLLGLRGKWHAVSVDGAKEETIGELKGQERLRALTEVAGGLLSTTPASGKVRAAVYRMVAGLPGLKVRGTATDPLGRTGAVVSMPLKTTVPLGLYTAPKQLGSYTRQWIIDTGTGMLLATRDLVATPPHGSLRLPSGDNGKPRRLTVATQPDRFHRPGEVLQYDAYKVAEWTDSGPKG